MISGNLINLRLFEQIQDVVTNLTLYNQLSERSNMDHTEIFSYCTMTQRFKETGLWTATKGSLLVTKKNDEIIGTMSFAKRSEFELEIGYRLYKKENRQKGYMTEALRLFSAYLFETIPHITRLKILTAEDNWGSRKLAEKCGYVQEGILRKAYFYRGHICNMIVYSLLREECVSINFE